MTHLNASTSTWKGELVFALFKQVNIKSPLQSLATTANMENDWPTAASKLIFMTPLTSLVLLKSFLKGKLFSPLKLPTASN